MTSSLREFEILQEEWELTSKNFGTGGFTCIDKIINVLNFTSATVISFYQLGIWNDNHDISIRRNTEKNSIIEKFSILDYTCYYIFRLKFLIWHVLNYNMLRIKQYFNEDSWIVKYN